MTTRLQKSSVNILISIPILNIPSNGYKCPHSSEQNPFLKILDKYKDHPSIKLIKVKTSSNVFKFRRIDIEEVKKTLQSIDLKKATQKDHVNRLCKRASLKLNALARIAPFMNVSKKRIIMKSFIESQFGYCPLIWMFHSRGLNNKINRIHERVLRITYLLKIDL